ncbi:hypothetical protein LTR27_000461 [Elasticomyces elasticus]|nr:hypothetical protein LTR27_000461 [Elasticomyces elasticus]
MAPPTRPRGSYMVGIICALDVEKAAIDALLDEEHGGVAPVKNDNNNYSFGRIGQHDVVIACLPAGVMGKASAATVANDMMRSFPIKVGFMVGIGGGVPNDTTDVRLGDVVVSEPTGMHGGVVQWDFGKIEEGGKFVPKGTLDKPPRPLLNAVAALKATHLRKKIAAHQHFEEMIVNNPRMKKYHPGGATCAKCDPLRLKERQQREDDKPRIHFGNIASGDKVMKDGLTRDRLAQEWGIICFEMEASGLMDTFPCVVIRGICDYADSHKNKRWQSYAAATAACYCKELLGVIHPHNVAELDLASYLIPFDLKGIPATQHFVQRDVPMKQLEAFFLAASQPAFESTSQPAGRKVFVVHGLGGIGKTQLCVAFARKYQEDFSAILWLDGSSEDAVRQSLANAYQRLPATFKTPTVDIQGSIDGLLQWLSLPDNTGWLLIFDNVDRDLQSVPKDPQAFNYRDFLPSADHGSVLVTTRLSRMQIPKASLQLLKLDDRCAKEMLEDWVGKKLLGKATGSDDVDKLLEKLGGLPLALVQAGAYLRETNTSIEEYLESYERTWTSLMEHQEKHPAPDYQERTMLTTWNMSCERVWAVNPQAIAILDQWAFLHSGDIWYELATSPPQKSGQDSTAEVVTMIATDKLAFRNSLGVLANYSLVIADIEGTGFSIHPVVHAWCLHTVTRAGMRKQLCAQAIVLVVHMIIQTQSGSYKSTSRRLGPHAKVAATRYLDGGEKFGPPICLCMIADFLNNWSSLAVVEALYLRALEGFKEELGLEHESTLSMLNRLGVFYFSQGKMKEAEEMNLQALRVVDAWGPTYMPNENAIHAINNLGTTYYAQRRLEQAENMFSRALSIGEAWGAGNTLTLEPLRSLGNLYADQGKVEEAEKMFRRALNVCEEPGALRNLSAVETICDLGTFYGRQGRYEEAMEKYLQALELGEEESGPMDQATLDTVKNLGSLYLIQRNYKEAEKMILRALKGFEETRGPGHIRTLATVCLLGKLYYYQGKLAKARRMYTRATEGFEHAAGDNVADIRSLRQNLALIRKHECKSTPSRSFTEP